MAVCKSGSLRKVALSGVTCAALAASLMPLAQVAIHTPSTAFAQGCGEDSDGNPLPCNNVVPEPSTLLLMAPAAGYLVMRMRQRLKK